MEKETLEAKLRNQLTPIYGLIDLILILDEKPQVKDLLIAQAKQALINKVNIDSILIELEERTNGKPQEKLRERAMNWWNNKSTNDGIASKWSLSYKYFDRHWMGLTGSEIEFIYKCEVVTL